MSGRSTFLSFFLAIIMGALFMVGVPSYLYASHGHDFPDTDEADVKPCELNDCEGATGDDDGDDDVGDETDDEADIEIPE